MRRAAVLVGAMTAAALLLLGIALLVYRGTDDEDSASSSRVIDEQRGSYRGVELGSTREEAENALGDARWARCSRAGSGVRPTPRRSSEPSTRCATRSWPHTWATTRSSS